ncbi:MAG: hypothetical protein HY019_21035 [Aquabacterium sp.]|uniref:hypothetical protein n=1 Tax=Aquabacterium sp. TaxID=1872578 RepID=UPI0025B9BF08|nr:hypothetical protein [Aquabacterium sp.]MBI3384491.1 hypothetical protein [Aquabacterium sp.]
MQIITALKDLGFNFWQVVVLFVVLLFRNEIRQVLDRLKSLKLAGSELALQDTDVGLVRELKKIETEASESKVTVEELRDELSSVLRRRCIAALLQIRTLTSVLWPHLKNLADGQTALIVDIRNSTYKEIEQSVRLLSAAGMFDFSLLPAREQDGLQKMRLFDIHPLFKSLVKEAESY